MGIKETIDRHPLVILTVVGITALGAGWQACVELRVNVLNDKIAEYKEIHEEDKANLEKYEKTIKLKSEFDSLVVYDGNDWIREGEEFAILGGQVSIKVASIIGSENIRFVIDAVGESELQDVSSSSGQRAIFKYKGIKYLINIKECITSEVKLSISEIKKA